MSGITARVIGDPAPQGSKRCFCRGGRATVVESSSARVKAWRAAIVAALPADLEPFQGPVQVDVHFYLPRPKAMREEYVTHAKRPDLDKLVRSTLDALTTARVVQDDAQVAILVAQKRYCATGEQPGASIRAWEIQ